VGALYAELDEWKARMLELRAQRNPSATADERAREAREQARQTYETAHGEAAEKRHFTPSPDLKSLFRETAKRIHPDLAKDSADLEYRTQLMTEANRAYEEGDAEALRRILGEYQDDAVEGEGVAAELVRLIRQISAARARVVVIERDLAALRESEIALLMKQAEAGEQEGRDVLAELANAVREQVELAKKEYEMLAKRTSPT
jgi:hypothetical protein